VQLSSHNLRNPEYLPKILVPNLRICKSKNRRKVFDVFFASSSALQSLRPYCCRRCFFFFVAAALLRCFLALVSLLISSHVRLLAIPVRDGAAFIARRP
jgi:hypothetical protein